MRVVVDTNAFYADLGMRGGLRVLLEAARKREIILIVPEVVLQEVLKQFRERYRRESARSKDAARALSEFGVEGVDAPDLPDLTEAAVKYEADLRGRLHDVGAVISLVPAVSHVDVLERAIHRRKPFKQSGAGYQDTLIWLSVLDEAEVGEVAFISGNTSDFGELNGERWELAEDLRADLAERREAKGVTLYPSVREFIATNLSVEEDDLGDLRAELMIDDENVQQAYMDAIAEELVRPWTPVGVTGLLRGAEVEEARVVGASVESIELDEAYALENDELYAVLRARATADVEFTLGAREAEGLGREERMLIDFSTEGLATGRKRAPLDVSVDVVLDRDREVKGFDVIAEVLE